MEPGDADIHDTPAAGRPGPEADAEGAGRLPLSLGEVGEHQGDHWTISAELVENPDTTHVDRQRVGATSTSDRGAALGIGNHGPTTLDRMVNVAALLDPRPAVQLANNIPLIAWSTPPSLGVTHLESDGSLAVNDPSSFSISDPYEIGGGVHLVASPDDGDGSGEDGAGDGDGSKPDAESEPADPKKKGDCSAKDVVTEKLTVVVLGPPGQGDDPDTPEDHPPAPPPARGDENDKKEREGPTTTAGSIKGTGMKAANVIAVVITKWVIHRIKKCDNGKTAEFKETVIITQIFIQMPEASKRGKWAEAMMEMLKDKNLFKDAAATDFAFIGHNHDSNSIPWQGLSESGAFGANNLSDFSCLAGSDAHSAPFAYHTEAGAYAPGGTGGLPDFISLVSTVGTQGAVDSWNTAVAAADSVGMSSDGPTVSVPNPAGFGRVTYPLSRMLPPAR